jgi:hypothetical protein
MILDKQLMFSDQQNLAQAAGSYLSTNTVDLGATGSTFHGSPPDDFGKGSPKRLLAEVTTAFTSGGSGTLQVQVVTADDAALTSNLTVQAETPVLALATLVAGYQVPLNIAAGIKQRYLGLRYIIGTATMTAGAVSAGIVIDKQQGGT